MSDAYAFEATITRGGVAVFPSDTVYGLACDPENAEAVSRLYELKGRPPAKPSAVMFFDLDAALGALPELGPRTREVMRRLLPGAVSVIVPNPERRFPLAGGGNPDAASLGIRVPDLPRLRSVRRPVLQSSANLSGGADPTTLHDVPVSIRAEADLVLDGGELPGVASTYVDLRSYEEDGEWRILREGAVRTADVAEAIDWDPERYPSAIRADIPAYERLQDALVKASGAGARRILDLGTGTGETAQRLLERHPEATLLGVDASEAMLAAAREVLPADRAELRRGRLEAPLPDGPFDLVASALCVHHLEGPAKADLFRRIAAVTTPDGRFVLADLIVPEDPRIPLTPGTPRYDFPSPLADQLAWLREAGFHARLTWSEGDLAVIAATRR